MNVKIYPEQRRGPYYIEFSAWGDKPLMFQLFQEQCHEFAISEINPKGLVHPWKLSEGAVAPSHLICLETESYLKWMVDAMNEKFNRDNIVDVTA